MEANKKMNKKKLVAVGSMVSLVILLLLGLSADNHPVDIPEIIEGSGDNIIFPTTSEDVLFTPTPPPPSNGGDHIGSEIPTPTPTQVVTQDGGFRTGPSGGSSGNAGGYILPTLVPTPIQTLETESPELLICDQYGDNCRDKGDTTPILDIYGICPGEEGYEVIGLKNDGDDPGNAIMKFYNVAGDLSNYLNFTIFVNDGEPVTSGSLVSLDNQNIELGYIGVGEVLAVKVCWEILPQTGNEAQGATATFDLNFSLSEIEI